MYHGLVCWKPAFCAHRVWRNSSFYLEMQSSLCDYRDGGFPWTTHLHQILFQVRENSYRMLWNFEDSFSGTKTQSSQWKNPGSPRPNKARQVRSNIKSMLIFFFDQNGIVHKEFVPPGQTVNVAFYVEVLKRLRENVRKKRPNQWRNNTWLLHHDNAPAHAALLTRRFLTDNIMTVVPHPPYSPDLAPSDFFLFPKLKMKLRGEDFRRRKFKQSRRPSWTRYEKITSKNASKTGSAAGIVVKPQKGTTLKVMPTLNV